MGPTEALHLPSHCSITTEALDITVRVLRSIACSSLVGDMLFRLLFFVVVILIILFIALSKYVLSF